MCCFLGAIVAQKAYTLLLYSISEARFTSYGTAIVTAFGIVCASISSIWLPANRVVDTLFLCIGIILPVLLLMESHRQKRACTNG
jgi:hypothetical protein